MRCDPRLECVVVWKAIRNGALMGAVLYALIGGAGVVAMGDGFGVGLVAFMLIGAFLGVALRSIYRDIRRPRNTTPNDQ